MSYALRMPRCALSMLLLLCFLACGKPPEDPTPELGVLQGRPEIIEAMREDMEVERHPSDGGGRATIVQEEPSEGAVRAGEPGRWRIEYTAGPHGIAEGGILFLQVSPFWGWSTPQPDVANAPGYTIVSTDAAGVDLHATTFDRQLLGVEIGGRALRGGERVTLTYGAGESGAFADRYAEAKSYFWIAVDGDGDGIRKTIVDSPYVPVAPNDPIRLLVTVPSTATVGAPVRLTVAALDALGNAGHSIEGPITLELGDGLEGTTSLIGGQTSLGARVSEVVPLREGIFRVIAKTSSGLAGISNPILVSNGPRILWGDLHGHSAFSDGTGTPRDYLRYARDVSSLDAIALTDHDHWGMLALASYPHLWEEIRRETELFHDPGRFVTLLGYEWTNWRYGHRHVLYFEDEGEIYDSIQTEYEHPDQLWAALRGRPALTFAHHSAGGPIATDWSIPPDPELEPVTEITSVHGSSEALDSPGVIYSPKPGNFVRDVLDLGYRLGFIGSGDSHDGHPGQAHFASPSGGLAAIIAEDATRESVLHALKNRRVYATNGPRIVLRLTLDGAPMGSAIPTPDETAALRGFLVGEAPIVQLDVVRSGEVQPVLIEPDLSLAFDVDLDGLVTGESIYVRAVQEDGGTVWSSPFFID